MNGEVINDYDPVGGHTKEEADAAYEALLRELHGQGESESDIRGGARPLSVCVITGRSPSVDGICAAICCARLKNTVAEGDGRTEKCAFTPYLADAPEPNSAAVATAFATLAHFGAKLPNPLTEISGKDVILVDFNDPARAPAGLADAHILEIIDRHALAGLTTSAPSSCRIRPVGATSTLVYEYFMEYEIDPDPDTAGLLCAGIVAATRLFTTPETTRTDRLAAATLANTCALDLSSLFPGCPYK